MTFATFSLNFYFIPPNETDFYLEYTQISKDEMLNILKGGFISNIFTSKLFSIIPSEYLKYKQKFIKPYLISPDDTVILFQRDGDRLTDNTRKGNLSYKYLYYKVKLIPKKRD